MQGIKGENSHQCDVCKVYFLTKDHLTTHRLQHLTAYRCTWCDARTSVRKRARQHAVTHQRVGQEKYECSACEKTFPTRSKLQYHRSKHHKEKLQCDCCGKVFASKMTLKYHLKSQSQNKEDKPKEEKLYIPCKGCNKVFHSKKSYRAHVVIHNGLTYPCPICGKLFQWKRNLARHTRNHRERDAGATHECRACGKTFASRDCYNNHMRLSKRHVPEDAYRHAFTVDRNPGGSLCIKDPVDLGHGSVRRKELDQSIYVGNIEKVAAMAVDEEAQDHIDHVRKWLDDCDPLQSVEPVTNDQGSELDSDFDDEFVLEDLAGKERNIPDDQELDEGQLQLVNNVTAAIDEAVEDLVEGSEFVWNSDFSEFTVIPETFKGSEPGPVNKYDSPLEAFESIWDRDIMELIATQTNIYASQKIAELKQAGNLTPSSRLHKWTDTCVDEMYLFFGILILMGIDPRTSQHEFWKTTGYLELPSFRALMSYNRYILLCKFLHFVDNTDNSQNGPQNERTVSAKLKKIAPLIVHLNNKFSSLYNLHTDIAIDESLTLFKGRLSWIQAIRTKAARFGIKSYELCESRSGYMYKFDIYTGKNSERPVETPIADLAGKSAQAVLDLLKGLENRGHCVTMANFYNCPALARHLKRCGFDCLGTLRPNRKHVPAEIAKAPKNLAKGTIIARHSGDVSCLVWKDSKLVTMISTYHNTDTYVGRKAGKELVKPVVVRDYNNTMGGVDLKDQKLSMFLVERKRCVKWYAKMFKRLLNCSVLNAFVMLTESLKRRGMPVLSHRDFREKLANSLVRKFLHFTPTVSNPSGDITRLQRHIVHVPNLTGVKKRAACHICNRNGTQKKVQLKCDTCDEFLCPGECWKVWHSEQNLPGRDVKVRKGGRRKV